MKPQSLDTLPFDVFYQIATSLDDRDFINLSRSNRALRALTQSEQIARKTVEVGCTSIKSRPQAYIHMIEWVTLQQRRPGSRGGPVWVPQGCRSSL
jgi:hypothetical protein